jgi:hypothetical protein
MFGTPRARLRVLACAVVASVACKGGGAREENPIGDAVDEPEDAGADSGGQDGGARQPLAQCSTTEDGTFTDEIGLAGIAPFAMNIAGDQVHVVYLTPTCVDAGTAHVLGTGLAHLTFGIAEPLPAQSEKVYANDPADCRDTREPVVASAGESTRAYFFGDDPTLHVTSEVYGLEIGASAAPTRISNVPGEETSLAASVLGGAPLLAWVGSEQGKPATLWTVLDDGEPQPYLLLPASEKHSPGRIALATVSDTKAALLWSTTGEVQGVFLQMLDRKGEPVGRPVRVSTTSGEVAIAVAPKPDENGYVGTLAYTVDSRLRFRRFGADGKLETGYRVISPGNVTVSGIGITPAFGSGYAASYRSRTVRDGHTSEVVQVTVTDSQGNVAGDRVLAQLGTGVGPVRLEQTRDGRFMLAWIDRTSTGVRLHVQRTLCQ